MTPRSAAAVLATMLLLGLGAPAGAQGAEDRAADIARNVMSPFCPGLTLHDCPTQESVELRADIERMAQAGWSDERIMTELENEYGPSIRAIPDGSSTIWLIPGAMLAAGLVLAYVVSRRWTRTEEPSQDESRPPSASDRQRLRAELGDLKERLGGRP